MIKLKIFRAYPYLKPHISFCSNGLAIWHGLSDIRHIKVSYGDGRPIKQVKFQKPQKAHLHPPKGCVCQKLKKSMHGLQSSAPETETKYGHPDAGRTDGRTSEATPIPPAPTSSGGG